MNSPHLRGEVSRHLRSAGTTASWAPRCRPARGTWRAHGETDGGSVDKDLGPSKAGKEGDKDSAARASEGEEVNSNRNALSRRCLRTAPHLLAVCSFGGSRQPPHPVPGPCHSPSGSSIWPEPLQPCSVSSHLAQVPAPCLTLWER